MSYTARAQHGGASTATCPSQHSPWIASHSSSFDCYIWASKATTVEDPPVCRAAEGAPYVQERPAHNTAQFVGLVGQARPAFRPHAFFILQTPPKHAAEPRDCPCRPQAPPRVAASDRVRNGVTSCVRARVNDTCYDRGIPCFGYCAFVKDEAPSPTIVGIMSF